MRDGTFSQTHYCIFQVGCPEEVEIGVSYCVYRQPLHKDTGSRPL